MKKVISAITAAALAVSAFAFSASAAKATEVSLYADGDVKITGSSYVKGNAVITRGNISGLDYCVSGTAFLADGATSSVYALTTAKYNEAEKFAMHSYKSEPEKKYFIGSDAYDGNKDYIVGWGDSDQPGDSTISENSFFNELKVNPSLNLNIKAAKGEVTVIRARKLTLSGSLSITGGGSVVIYADSFGKGSNETINKSGSASQLTLVCSGGKGFSIDTFADINANVIVPNGDLMLNNTARMTGNIYAGGDVHLTNSGNFSGAIYAPAAQTKITGSFSVTGCVVTKSLSMSGHSKIIYNEGSFSLPKEVDSVVSDDSGSGSGGSGGSEDSGEKIDVTAVIPRKMSVRLENGVILKNGDKFEMKKGGTIKFQMCTNNWDTDLYSDDGQGIAGTKVYSFTQSNKTGAFMRVDTNTYFMAVRFHFKNGDYNKQTGIKNVVKTPIESWSVNLPLGSTITSDAYKAFSTKLDTANVFVETAEDKSLSYTDFYWKY